MTGEIAKIKILDDLPEGEPDPEIRISRKLLLKVRSHYASQEKDGEPWWEPEWELKEILKAIVFLTAAAVVHGYDMDA